MKTYVVLLIIVIGTLISLTILCISVILINTTLPDLIKIYYGSTSLVCTLLAIVLTKIGMKTVNPAPKQAKTPVDSSLNAF